MPRCSLLSASCKRSTASAPVNHFFPDYWPSGSYDVGAWLDSIAQDLRAREAGVAFRSLSELVEDFSFELLPATRAQLNQCASLLGMPPLHFPDASANGSRKLGEPS
jgi:hypothetical protein